MTHKKALEASKCDPEGVMKVLEKLKVECPECKGNSYRDFPRVSISPNQNYNCSHCCDTGKISYSYQPQVGEWCIYAIGSLGLIYKARGKQWVKISGYGYELHKDSVTPILPWETIEEILGKAGLRIDIDEYDEGYNCTIIAGGSKKMAAVYGKSRLPAVYEAVLALGKGKNE